jgi:hypothetical protein
LPGSYSIYTSRCTRVSHGLPYFYLINICVMDIYLSLILSKQMTFQPSPSSKKKKVHEV